MIYIYIRYMNIYIYIYIHMSDIWFMIYALLFKVFSDRVWHPEPSAEGFLLELPRPSRIRMCLLQVFRNLFSTGSDFDDSHLDPRS